MLWVQRFWLRLQTLFGRNRSAERLHDEIQFHLEQQIAENVAAGMSREEARYAAMRGEERRSVCARHHGPSMKCLPGALMTELHDG